MSNPRYSNAQRLALAIKRDALLVEARSSYTEAAFREEFAADIVGDELTLTSGPVAIAEAFPAWKRGDLMNVHRAIIARKGALR